MKTPAAPGTGRAGAEIVNETNTERSCSTPRPAASNAHVDVPPNWRRLGTIVDKFIADLAPEST